MRVHLVRLIYNFGKVQHLVTHIVITRHRFPCGRHGNKGAGEEAVRSIPQININILCRSLI